MLSMCSLLFVLLNLLLVRSSNVVNAKNGPNWGAKFDKYVPPMQMGECKELKLNLHHLNKNELIGANALIRVVSDSPILGVYKLIPVNEIDGNAWNGSFSAEAIFIGHANVYAEIVRQNKSGVISEKSAEHLAINIMRKPIPEWQYTEIYTIYENSLYVILRILFGCVLDYRKFSDIIRKPMSLGISIISTFIFTPLFGYVLGFIIFPDSHEMQFVLFVIAVCLMKGICNLYTIIIGGNIDLSITISIINNILACGMIPLWIYTLGATKYPESDLKIQYYYFPWNLFYFIFPLGIGAAIQCCILCCLPRSTKLLIVVLRLLSLLYIISITIVAIDKIWDMLTPRAISLIWTYISAGFVLPSITYTAAWLMAMIVKLDFEDRIAIAVETINYNMTLSMSTIVKLLKGYSKQELAIFLCNMVIIMRSVPIIVQFIWNRLRSQRATLKITEK